MIGSATRHAKVFTVKFFVEREIWVESCCLMRCTSDVTVTVVVQFFVFSFSFAHIFWVISITINRRNIDQNGAVKIKRNQ